MPNHVMNIVTFEECSKERLAEILQAIRSENGCCINFEKIIPMPGNIYRGVLGMKEREVYGENNWFDWCIKNWGTKWNAYDCEESGNPLRFSTAWSAPHPVIEALAKRFPDVYIIHKWADEDLGMNCGERVYEDGELAGYNVPDSGKEAMDFAMEVWGETPEDLGNVLNEDGTDYVYKGDDADD